MRMLQPRNDENLATEPLGVHVRHELRCEDLYHDASLEGRVVRNEDARHAAATELALDGEG